MANIKKIVKKSLHKFLSEGLNTYVTFDSKESVIKDVFSGVTINPDTILSSGVKTFELYEGGVLLQGYTSSQLVGQVLKIEDDVFSSDLITGYNELTSEITVQNGFEIDIDSSNFMSISQNSLIYMHRPHDIQGGGCLEFSEEVDRYDLIIKTKDDSSKDKIDDILQNIKNLIHGDRNNFIIYAEDLTTQVGYGRIYNYVNEGEINVSNDIQSYLSTFQVSYYVNYLK